VTNNVNGLHFSVNDPGNLAAAIERAASEPGLWERLREGIPDILTVEDHIANLKKMYQELLEHRSERVPQPAR
jgi:glycosyltransferase involved in cell wall biosynthesis